MYKALILSVILSAVTMGSFCLEVFSYYSFDIYLKMSGNKYAVCPCGVTVSTVGSHPTNRSSILRMGAKKFYTNAALG